VEAFGPSLVLLLAVLLAAWLARKAGTFKNVRVSARVDGHLAGGSGRSDELEAALDGAVTLNTFNANDRSDPSVRLQAVVRFTPSDYWSVADEIAQYFRRREVVSIDLGYMERGQAVRLVDFCNGMAVMCSGWIFRLTDKVIVLSPPN